MKLTIKQSNTPEIVTSEVIDGLYNLSSGGNLTNDSELEGNLQATAAYEDSVDYLRSHFPRLTINAASYYIRFADSEVESVLKTALGKTEGEGITTQEATNMNLGTIFKNNANIESFDEFKYFISLGKTLSQQAFYQCSNLKRIDLSNCTSYPNEAFSNLTNLEYTGGAGSPQGVIIIPEGTTSIGGWENFTNCDKITSVILPDSLTYINGNNFKKMDALTEITVGTGMTTWVRGNFGNCPNFSKVNIKDLDAWLNITFENTGDAETPLAVARHLYLNGTEVTSVDFTEKITIKDKVLWGCLGLTSVVLPNTITSIGNSAFRSCDNLVIADLNLPNLATLGSYAFNGTKLQTISNLGNIQSVPNSCFRNCRSLTSVILPSTVTTIDYGAFWRESGEGTNLQTITANWSNITSIGSLAFNNNTKLRFGSNFSLPSLISLSERAFETCGILETPASFGSVTALPNNCFKNCYDLTTANLPNTITSIGNACFTNCTKLVIPYLNLPNLTTLGSQAFQGTKVQTVSDLGSVTSIPNSCFENCSQLTSVSIPNSVTSIGSSAFRKCTSLTSLTIPDSVTTLGGNHIIDGCSALQTLILGSGLTVIPTGAFHNAALTTLTIPDNVTKIGSESFANLSSLTTITIGSGVTEIGNNAFSWCGALTSVTIHAVTPPTLGGTFITANSCPIYVPAGSVDAYKTADGWKDIPNADTRIQAIQTT